MFKSKSYKSVTKNSFSNTFFYQIFINLSKKLKIN